MVRAEIYKGRCFVGCACSLFRCDSKKTEKNILHVDVTVAYVFTILDYNKTMIVLL